MKAIQRLFQVAGVYGLVVLVPMFFMEATIARDFPPAITHPEFFYGFLWIAVMWQFIFLIIAKDPVKYRSVILVAIGEKVPYGITTLVLFSQQRLAASALVFGIIDLVLGALFLGAYLRIR